MGTNFDILPGVTMPVAEVTREIERVWKAEGVGPDASSTRASQLNLVIHTGLSTTQEEVLKLFETAVAFGQRTPCRIVLLCPRPEEDCEEEERLKGKLYTQCFVGESLREKCCCEALILSYQPSFAEFLENQITLWLEPDLPGYLWLHRVDPASIQDRYLEFASNFQRVVFDSSVDGSEMHALSWRERTQIKDFARARLLKILQSLGQFLSSYNPDVLVAGLSAVRISILDVYSGEGNNLLDWMRCCIKNCCALADIDLSKIAFELKLSSADAEDVAAVEWAYANEKFFHWRLNQKTRMAETEADFGLGTANNTQMVTRMEPVEVLSEALFFTTS